MHCKLVIWIICSGIVLCEYIVNTKGSSDAIGHLQEKSSNKSNKGPPTFTANFTRGLGQFSNSQSQLTANKDCPEHCECSVSNVCDLCKPGYTNVDLNCTCSARYCTAPCRNCLNVRYYPLNGTCCECLGTSQFQCNVSCAVGVYSQACRLNCRTKDPACVDCYTNSTGEYRGCAQCMAMYYLSGSGQCKPCSSCVDRACEPMSGRCIKGCVESFWSEKCDKDCPELCLQCEQLTGSCKGCKNHSVYGEYCDKHCSTSCLNKTCVENGSCDSGCKPEFFGAYCDRRCSPNCNHSNCLRESGKCESGCMHGHFGQYCDRNCSENCAYQTCDMESGHCTGGCVDGFFGEYCDRVCPSNCVNHTCMANTKACKIGCMDGFYGQLCENTCSSMCGHSCNRETGLCINVSANNSRNLESELTSDVIEGIWIVGVVLLSVIIVLVISLCVAKRRNQSNKKKEGRYENIEEVELRLATSEQAISIRNDSMAETSFMDLGIAPHFSYEVPFSRANVVSNVAVSRSFSHEGLLNVGRASAAGIHRNISYDQLPCDSANALDPYEQLPGDEICAHAHSDKSEADRKASSLFTVCDSPQGASGRSRKTKNLYEDLLLKRGYTEYSSLKRKGIFKRILAFQHKSKSLPEIP